MRIVKPSVTLLWHTPEPEKTIEMAARTCYRSEHKATEDSHIRMIKHLMASGHTAMLEHASASFRIVCSRAIANELVRHRIASFAQESTRYVRYDGIEVIQSEGIGDAEFGKWMRGILDAEAAYTELLGKGVKPQIARDVLPLALKTELVMTANFRSWLNFLDLRTAKDAHPDMQHVAGLIDVELQQIAPHVFGA